MRGARSSINGLSPMRATAWAAACSKTLPRVCGTSRCALAYTGGFNARCRLPEALDGSLETIRPRSHSGLVPALPVRVLSEAICSRNEPIERREVFSRGRAAHHALLRNLRGEASNSHCRGWSSVVMTCRPRRFSRLNSSGARRFTVSRPFSLETTFRTYASSTT